MPDLGGAEELGHPAGDSPDFLKDLVGCRGPPERFRVSVPVGRETPDRVAKDPGRREGSPRPGPGRRPSPPRGTGSAPCPRHPDQRKPIPATTEERTQAWNPRHPAPPAGSLSYREPRIKIRSAAQRHAP